jgi:hypothetical protein
MANAGKLETLGDWNKGWKDITVKLPGAGVAAELLSETENG